MWSGAALKVGGAFFRKMLEGADSCSTLPGSRYRSDQIAIVYVILLIAGGILGEAVFFEGAALGRLRSSTRRARRLVKTRY